MRDKWESGCYSGETALHGPLEDTARSTEITQFAARQRRTPHIDEAWTRARARVTRAGAVLQWQCCNTSVECCNARHTARLACGAQNTCRRGWMGLTRS